MTRRSSNVLRELGFSEDVVNVEGGAIAHGHPIGATGAVLTHGCCTPCSETVLVRSGDPLHRRRPRHRARIGTRLIRKNVIAPAWVVADARPMSRNEDRRGRKGDRRSLNFANPVDLDDATEVRETFGGAC
jgi:hypothetical protein